jgi:ABC-type sulfate transport system permease subunit
LELQLRFVYLGFCILIYVNKVPHAVTPTVAGVRLVLVLVRHRAKRMRNAAKAALPARPGIFNGQPG